uniref:SNF2 N-terminal domain-containing protein n=1 Tax=Acrobeloides nanus TaxID=290746 RepID=A0A914EM13_9BILA
MVLSQSDINELTKVLEESKVKQKEQTPEPKGLKKDVQLKKYQREGLTWLIWRESQPSSGGILADDMGLGKTLSTISLIVHQKNQEKNVKYKHGTLISSNTTLIIAKKSITHQWLEQITKFTEKGLLKTYIYESNGTTTRVRDPEL